MHELPTEAMKLLCSFQEAENYSLSVEKLSDILPDSSVYEYRIGQLLDAGFIEPCDYSSPRVEGNIFFSGSPISFCLTVKGQDYLSMLEQERKQRAKENRQKKNDEARAEKQNAKNLRYQRRTSIIAALIGTAFGSVGTLIIEHHDELIVWVKSLFSR